MPSGGIINEMQGDVSSCCELLTLREYIATNHLFYSDEIAVTSRRCLNKWVHTVELQLLPNPERPQGEGYWRVGLLDWVE